jgi:hypothetical protein
MKKLLIFPFLILVMSFSSCEKDPSLDPLPTIVPGQFMRLDITKHLLAFAHINDTDFGGMLTNPGGNVVKFELYVRYTTSNGVTAGNYVLLNTISSFPHDLKITPSELATALNMNITDFKQGDSFRFLGYSYDANNNKIGYNNLSATVKTQPGMKQAYKFITKLESDSEVAKNTFDNYEL